MHEPDFGLAESREFATIKNKPGVDAPSSEDISAGQDARSFDTTILAYPALQSSSNHFLLAEAPVDYNTDNDKEPGKGYFRTPYSLGVHPIYLNACFTHRHVFNTILFHTAWKPTTFHSHGLIFIVQPGQFCTTIRELTKLCGPRTTKKIVEKALQYLAKPFKTRKKPGRKSQLEGTNSISNSRIRGDKISSGKTELEGTREGTSQTELKGTNFAPLISLEIVGRKTLITITHTDTYEMFVKQGKNTDSRIKGDKTKPIGGDKLGDLNKEGKEFIKSNHDCKPRSALNDLTRFGLIAKEIPEEEELNDEQFHNYQVLGAVHHWDEYTARWVAKNVPTEVIRGALNKYKTAPRVEHMQHWCLRLIGNSMKLLNKKLKAKKEGT
jgi:hypothetical protein